MIRLHVLWVLPFTFLSLTSCTQFPELEETQTAALEAADYPDLIPIEPILAQVEGPRPNPDIVQAQTAGRLARLRGRAQKLRQPVLNTQEKQRLKEAAR